MRALLLLAALCIVPALAANAGCTAETASRVNPAFHESASPAWTELSEEAEFRRFRLQRVASSVPEKMQGSGRGVVMAVTEVAELASAHTALKQLRATGSTLQVEVAHQGVISAAVADEFEAIMGVHVRDVRTSEESTGLMASAIISSSFEDVLYLSPRTFAVANPESLFESSEFQSTGAVMWPSLYKTSPSNPIWSMVGQACVDAHEQSSAAFLVSKNKAWGALHVASHLGGSFYKSLLHGDDSSMYFGALVSNTAFVFAPASKAVHTKYTLAGVATQCAHATVMSSFSGAPAFFVAANNEVAMSGANAESLKCLANVQSVAQDDAMVSRIVAMQATVPSATLVAIQAACTVSEVTQTQYEAMVNTGGIFYDYATSIDRLTKGSSVEVVAISFTTYVDNCGSFFSCGTNSMRTTNTKTFFFNVTSSLRSANIDVSVPVVDDNGKFMQYGNETYLRVVDHSRLRDKCDGPLLSFPTHVYNYNIVTGGAAVVAVSWADIRPNWPNAIKVRVTYNGPSNSALSSKVMSAPLLLVAAIVAFAAQRLF